MKRRAAGFLLSLAAAGGCMTAEGDFLGRGMQPGMPSQHAMSMDPDQAPVGPWGVPMSAMSQVGMPGMNAGGNLGNSAAVMQASYVGDGAGIMQMSGCAGGACSLPGAPPMGDMGGMGMGGMGMGGPGGFAPGGRVNAFGQLGGAGGPEAGMIATRTQVRFAGPTGAKVGWYIGGPDGKPVLSPSQLDVPGRYNFAQAAIYRLKVSNIPGRPGVELYPTIEVVPSNGKTDAFLSHNVVPVEFTDEDFDQIHSGHYITKVIYLPDAQFQGLSGGAEEITSTRLEPGVDPVCEAQRRGHILLVVRVGSINLDVPNSPPLNAPGQFGAPPMGPQGAPPVPMGGHGMVPMMQPAPGNGVAPVGYSVPTHAPMMPGQMGPGQPPRVAFPQTVIPAPKGVGFDMDMYEPPTVRQREGLLDNVIWKK